MIVVEFTGLVVTAVAVALLHREVGVARRSAAASASAAPTECLEKVWVLARRQSGENLGRFAVESPVGVGSNPHCGIQLPVGTVESHHARLLPVDGGRIQVLSTASDSAIFIAGVPLMLHSVACPGEVIGLGDVELVVESNTSEASALGRSDRTPSRGWL